MQEEVCLQAIPELTTNSFRNGPQRVMTSTHAAARRGIGTQVINHEGASPSKLMPSSPQPLRRLWGTARRVYLRRRGTTSLTKSTTSTAALHLHGRGAAWATASYGMCSCA